MERFESKKNIRESGDLIKRTPAQDLELKRTVAQVLRGDEIASEDLAEASVVIKDGWQKAYEAPSAKGEPAYNGEPNMRKHFEEVVRLAQELLPRGPSQKENDPQSES